MSFTPTGLGAITACDECYALVVEEDTYSHERWHELLDDVRRAEWEKEQ